MSRGLFSADASLEELPPPKMTASQKRAEYEAKLPIQRKIEEIEKRQEQMLKDYTRKLTRERQQSSRMSNKSSQNSKVLTNSV